MHKLILLITGVVLLLFLWFLCQFIRERYRKKYGKETITQMTKNKMKMIPFQIIVTEVNQTELSDLCVRLVDLMEVENIYTNPFLTRRMLAEILNTNEKYLYETIKKYFNTNFNDFLNNYRLKHACKLLNESPLHTIESIATDSGFGSRYTFHRLFRERYSLTPDEFRKNNMKNKKRKELLK